MNHHPLVSAIIIFLNAESFIEEAIASIFAQTYKHWELLLVDDGSTDSSTAIAQQYAQQYPEKVRYLDHNQHQTFGISASRNLGIQYADGEYVGFLDADDVWLPEKLEQQVEILNNYPDAKMVYGKVQYWYSWTYRLEEIGLDYFCELGVYPNRIIAPPTLLLLMLQNQHQTATISDTLIRREVFHAIGKFEEFSRSYANETFFAKAQLQTLTFVSEKCWVKCRQNRSNYSAITENIENYSERLEFLNWVRDYLLKENYENTQVQQLLESEVESYSVDKVAERISSSFPELTIQSIQYLSQGMNNRAYRVNGEYIFKFPKNERAEILLLMEANALRLLHDEIGGRVPCPKFVKDDSKLDLNFPLGKIDKKSISKEAFSRKKTQCKSKGEVFFMGYKEIKGDFLYSDFVTQYSCEIQHSIAQEIADFLSSLHSLSLPEKSWGSIQLQKLYCYFQYYVLFLRKISCLIDREYRKELVSLFHKNLRNLLFLKNDRAFIHGDFNWDHIIFNEQQKRVAGFIDFGGVHTDDPAHDFVGILTEYGYGFLELVLKYYKAKKHLSRSDTERLKQRIKLIYCCNCIDHINSELRRRKTEGIEEKVELLKLLAIDLAESKQEK